jgi:hypothetical protein
MRVRPIFLDLSRPATCRPSRPKMDKEMRWGDPTRHEVMVAAMLAYPGWRLDGAEVLVEWPQAVIRARTRSGSSRITMGNPTVDFPS